MSDLKSAIQKATALLYNAATALLEAPEEYFLWRQQLINEPNIQAHNPMGMSPTGLNWKTKDHILHGLFQGFDQDKNRICYARIAPTKGDLIIRLKNQPQTKDAAIAAARESYYVVLDVDVRRDSQGRIIMSKIICGPDRSGKWQESKSLNK